MFIGEVLCLPALSQIRMAAYIIFLLGPYQCRYKLNVDSCKFIKGLQHEIFKVGFSIKQLLLALLDVPQTQVLKRVASPCTPSHPPHQFPLSSSFPSSIYRDIDICCDILFNIDAHHEKNIKEKECILHQTYSRKAKCKLNKGHTNQGMKHPKKITIGDNADHVIHCSSYVHGKQILRRIFAWLVTE